MGYYYCRKCLMMILSMWVLISCSESTEHVVGESENWSWKVHFPSRDLLTRWASSRNFIIGDTLVFLYDGKESVHEVNENDYTRCRTRGEGHVVHNDGNTKVQLTELGMKYFISGNKRHCKRGLRLSLLVTLPSIPPPPPSLAFPPPPPPFVAFPPSPRDLVAFQPPPLFPPPPPPPSVAFPPPPPPPSVVFPPPPPRAPVAFPPPPPALVAFPPPPPRASVAFPPPPPSPLAPSLSPSPSLLPSESPSASQSPSWSPSPSPNSSGDIGGGGRELTIWLGVLLAMMMMFLI